MSKSESWQSFTYHEVVELLLSFGAKHIIFSAVALSECAIIRELVSKYADALDKPMTAYENRKRPVHLAVIKRQPEALQALLELGADADATDLNGMTALDYAALSEEQTMVDLLLKHQASISLVAAIALGDDNRVKALQASKPLDDVEWLHIFEVACEQSSGKMIEAILNAGTPVNLIAELAVYGPSSMTPLHLAAWFGNIEAAKVLIAHGADLSIKDTQYHSPPLGWAIHNNQAAMVTYLKSLTD